MIKQAVLICLALGICCQATPFEQAKSIRNAASFMKTASKRIGEMLEETFPKFTVSKEDVASEFVLSRFKDYGLFMSMGTGQTEKLTLTIKKRDYTIETVIFFIEDKEIKSLKIKLIAPDFKPPYLEVIGNVIRESKLGAKIAVPVQPINVADFENPTPSSTGAIEANIKANWILDVLSKRVVLKHTEKSSLDDKIRVKTYASLPLVMADEVMDKLVEIREACGK